MPEDRDPDRLHCRQRKPAAVLAVLLGIPLFALFCCAPLCDGDVGWHLAFGAYIAEHHTIPTQDVFRFTPQEGPLHLHGWLSQVGFYALERLGGLRLFRAGTALIMLGTLGLLARVLYKTNRSVPLSALGVLVFVITSIHVFHPRSRIFTPLLFLLAFEQLGLDATALSARLLAGVFLLTVVWMNLHAEASVLPLFIVVLLASAAGTRPFPRRRAGSLAAAAALSCGALFVSPLAASWLADARQNYLVNRGSSVEWFNLIDYQNMLNTAFAQMPSEYRPMFVHLLGYPFALTLTVVIAVAYLASLAFRPKGAARMPGVLVNIWAFISAFSMQRNSWLLFIPIVSTLQVLSLRFGCMASPTETHLTRGRKEQLRAQTLGWRGWAATGTVLGLASLLLPAVIRPDLWRRYDDDGWDARMFPTKAVAFLEAARLGGDTFSPAEWGGYLLYARPDLRVFMHGHWAEAPKTYADYQAIIAQRADFADLLDRYRPGLLVVPAFWGAALPSAKWVEVFSNTQSRVCVRSDDIARLAAVDEYYRRLNVPFSRTAGFDLGQALAMAPAWAREFRLQAP